MLLQKIRGVQNLTTGEEYIRMVAISRIMLPNIKNIQASWLTVDKKVAQICLHAGANDFGSIMLEENVVSAAGAPHRFTYKSMQDAIREAGFALKHKDIRMRPITLIFRTLNCERENFTTTKQFSPFNPELDSF